MQLTMKVRSRLFFIVLFLVLMQIFSTVAVADSSLTDKEALDKEYPSTKDSDYTPPTDNEISPDPPATTDAPAPYLSPSKSRSSDFDTILTSTQPYTSSLNAVKNNEKYAPSLTAAPKTQVVDHEILAIRLENTLNVKIQSYTTEFLELSALGQRYTGDGEVEISLPPDASLTHLLVIVFAQNQTYAQYVPL